MTLLEVNSSPSFGIQVSVSKADKKVLSVITKTFPRMQLSINLSSSRMSSMCRETATVSSRVENETVVEEK